MYDLLFHRPEVGDSFMGTLFKNYLFKLKIFEKTGYDNSAYECGRSINICLKALANNKKLKAY